MSETLLDTAPPADDRATVLSVRDLVTTFSTSRGTVQAVSGLDLDVLEGETLSIVGESGSGKSTAVMSILGLIEPDSGRIVYDDQDLRTLPRRVLRRIRADLQLIMQDPIASLNPRLTVREIVAEGLRIWPERAAGDVDGEVDNALEMVGLPAATLRERRPTQFSGGQCQRIAIARALVLHPRVLLCDEPVSSLDVSVQARVLDVLRKAQREHDLSIVFVSHDLGVVKSISDRVLVMYLGRACEVGPVAEIYERPAHPYTRLLLASAPGSEWTTEVDPNQDVSPPSPLDPPSGCRFRTRCPRATELCAQEAPAPREIAPGHVVHCHHPHLPEGSAVTDGTDTGAVVTITPDPRPEQQPAQETR